jgi:hypothetical protein
MVWSFSDKSSLPKFYTQLPTLVKHRNQLRINISPEIEKITVPFWSGMGLSGTLHTRSTSEAFIRAASKHKKMTMIFETNIHFWAYAPQFLEKHVAFFDYWLKGIKNGIMDEAPINMMVRTGWMWGRSAAVASA